MCIYGKLIVELTMISIKKKNTYYILFSGYILKNDVLCSLWLQKFFYGGQVNLIFWFSKRSAKIKNMGTIL